MYNCLGDIMKITNILAGIATKHTKGHVFSYPEGTDFWLIMGFHTGFKILNDGKVQNGSSGDFIIQPPHTPLFHTDNGKGESGFENDWILVYGEELDELFAKLDLPVNKIFSLPDMHFMRHFLKKIISELQSRPQHWELKCEAIYTEMLVSLKRAFEKSQTANLESFNRIAVAREQMLLNFDKDWTVEKIASVAGLSPSRFLDLYKRYYGTTPISDLIKQRLENSKILLMTTTHKLETVALMCGFSSINYFSNCFKKHEKNSPSVWRSASVKKGGRNSDMMLVKK